MQNNAKLILTDQTELPVMATSTAERINVRIGAFVDEFQKYADHMTKNNLSSFRIQRESNEESGKYMEISGIVFHPDPDGYLVNIDLQQRDPYEIMKEILETQETQSEAIEDLGQVIAEIAGGD